MAVSAPDASTWGMSQRPKRQGELDNNGVARGAKNPVNASRLWRLCEELTGARLD